MSMLKEKVIQAYMLAKELHKGQFRKFTGAPYFVHPKAVARMADELTGDIDIVIAALLHDTVEDCNITLEQIKLQFGESVALLVGYVTTTQEDKDQGLPKKEMMLRKMLDMPEKALTLKLLDRFDNVRYMDKDCKTNEQKEFVKRYTEETSFILNGLVKIKKTKLQNAIIRMIESRLEYVRIKHLW